MKIMHLDESPPDENRKGDCTDPPLGYMQWHADADRRHKRGQVQAWCERCTKWQWALCEAAKAEQKH